MNKNEQNCECEKMSRARLSECKEEEEERNTHFCGFEDRINKIYVPLGICRTHKAVNVYFDFDFDLIFLMKIAS